MLFSVLAGRLARASLQVALAIASSYGAWWLAEGAPPRAAALVHWARLLSLLVPLRALAYWPFGLYGGLWRYASVRELTAIVGAVVAASATAAVIAWPLGWLGQVPSGFFVIDALLLVFLLGAVRLVPRLPRGHGAAGDRRRVLVYGAGDAGAMILRDMLYRADSPYQPVGVVDDDPAKQGLRVHGVTVLGGRSVLHDAMMRLGPDEVLLAMPSASLRTLRDIVTALQPYQVPIKTLPGIHELPECHVEIAQIRPLALDDLLSRPVLGLDPEPVRRLMRGRRVLVTGAGGSIGSELCRQILGWEPEALVVLERHENALFWLTAELAPMTREGTRVVAALGDVTSETGVDRVFTAHRPHIVFHAAAHKHVPMLEDNVCEAVRNNVTGTLALARAAERHGVERFVLISTDKAVNPISVMGATKRVAELVVQVLMKSSATRFCAVRFGNVLGSNGSVTQVFLRQIKAGGPVTITDPDMRRYFMVISEAVALVQHAAALAEPGTVYVLDMGEPIRIVDLARQLIRLAGYRPDLDIPVRFTGCRPGERLTESLAGDDETLEAASTAGILRCRPARLPPARALEQLVHTLAAQAAQGDEAGARRTLEEAVSGMPVSR